jgi:DNA-directed RNA polymerase III subunit RPC1
LYPYEILQLAQAIYPESQPKVAVVEDLKPAKGRKARTPKKAAKLEHHVDLLPGWDGCHSKYRENTYNFIKDKVVGVMVKQRVTRGLPAADNAEEAEEYQADLDSDDRE